jgi:hypothetical protein
MEDISDLYRKLGVVEYNITIYTETLRQLQETKETILLEIDKLEAKKIKDEGDNMDKAE